MPRPRYVVVLAKDTHEGNVYAKRAGLPRGNYRVATSANSVKGLRVADVHILPGFETRRDKHAIRAMLRWMKDKQEFEVEMPEAPPRPVEDQGDGMGPQTDIFEQIEAAEAADDAATPPKTDADPAEVVSTVTPTEEPDGSEAGETEPSEDAAPAPKAKRQRRAKPANLGEVNDFGGPDAVREPVALGDTGFGGPDLVKGEF